MFIPFEISTTFFWFGLLFLTIFITFPFPLSLVREGVHFLKFFFHFADSVLSVDLSPTSCLQSGF